MEEVAVVTMQLARHTARLIPLRNNLLRDSNQLWQGLPRIATALVCALSSPSRTLPLHQTLLELWQRKDQPQAKTRCFWARTNSSKEEAFLQQRSPSRTGGAWPLRWVWRTTYWLRAWHQTTMAPCSQSRRTVAMSLGRSISKETTVACR